ncbi:MAG: hypothetical protein Q7U39_18875 [Nitrospira sp.]|nr:hypothetical protein [Nitrospira sp.]
MWILLLMGLLLVDALSFAEQIFPEQYERDDTIFNLAAPAFAPDHPFNPANRLDMGAMEHVPHAQEGGL